VKTAGLRFGKFVIDVSQIAVEHVDLAVFDGQPSTAIEHASAPGAQVEDLTGPTHGA